MKILMTGSTGFVGKNLLLKLSKREHIVTALLREPSGHNIAHNNDVLFLAPDANWVEQLRGMDALIHTGDGYNAFEDTPLTHVNKEAEKRLKASKILIQAAIKAKIPKLIFLSSIKTVCGSHCQSIVSEQTPARPSHLYGSLKLQTEKFLNDKSKDSQTQAIILRFPLTFDAESRGSFGRLIKLADSPWPLPLAGLDNRRSLISLDSLTDIIVKVTELNDRKPSGTFFVHDGAVTVTDMMVQLRTGLRRPERLFPMHRSLWSMMRHTPKVKEIAQRFSGSLEISDQHFRETFHLSQQYDLNLNLKKAAMEYRKNQLD